MKKKLVYLLPFLLFVVLVGFLLKGLDRAPHVKEVPSPLIGKPAPDFVLPRLEDAGQTISPKDMLGKVWILNVWASWCPSCRVEHQLVKYLASTGEVDIVGLNWRDERADGLNWLRQLGNPYLTNAYDNENEAGIDWGVYGAPESFLIDKQGIVRHKVIGPITADAVKETLLPMIRELNAQ